VARPAPRTDHYGQAFEAGILTAYDLGNGRDGVFFGDSIVQQLALDPDQNPYWKQLQGGHRLMSGAIAGDRIRNALGRMWAIAPTAKLVALQIGSNDHAGGGNPAETAEGIASFVAQASHLAPEAVILLIAIPPTTETARHEKNLITNDLMATLVDGDRVRMVYPSPPLDMSNPDHSPDGLHFTPAGAALWFGTLAPLFSEILGG
jgi:lysophospholipase L1-like esterase